LDQESLQDSADRQRSREAYANTPPDGQCGSPDKEPHDGAGARAESHANPSEGRDVRGDSLRIGHFHPNVVSDLTIEVIPKLGVELTLESIVVPKALPPIH
jgi:hypothetical protein